MRLLFALLFALLLTSSFILHTSPSHAQRSCVESRDCTDGTGQYKLCYGTPDQTGKCDFSAAPCDPCLGTPGANPAPATPAPEGNSSLPVTAPATSPSLDPNPSPSGEAAQALNPDSTLPSKEEAAIYRMNQGTVPKEAIAARPTDESLIQLLTNLSGGLLGLFQGLFTKDDPPRDEARYYAESESLHQAKLPPETKKQEPNFIDTLKGYLGVGSSAGIYSATIPAFEGLPKNDAKPYEGLYQRANFPEGVYPIVDPTATPTPPVTAI